MTKDSTHIEPTVTLGGKAYPVRVLPFCDLKRATVAFSRAGHKLAHGVIDDETMSDLATVVSAGICVAKELFEQMTMRQDELNAAFVTVAKVAGMVPEEQPKEGQAKEDTGGKLVSGTGHGTGTTSMPTSLRVPAGLGTTSTST